MHQLKTGHAPAGALAMKSTPSHTSVIAGTVSFASTSKMNCGDPLTMLVLPEEALPINSTGWWP